MTSASASGALATGRPSARLIALVQSVAAGWVEGEEGDAREDAPSVLFLAGGGVGGVGVGFAADGGGWLCAAVEFYEPEAFPFAGGEDDEGVGPQVAAACVDGEAAPADRFGFEADQLQCPGSVGFVEGDGDLADG